jgi:hypothetical protein
LDNGAYELSLELYKKEMKQLVDVKGGVPLVNTLPWEQNVEKNGTGKSEGLELFLQKKQGSTTGWISYTWSKADRLFQNLNNGKPYPFKYDRRHDFSIVFNRELSRNLDFSATWIYGSGYPTTLYNGVYQAIQPKGFIESPTDIPFDMGYHEAALYPGKNWLRMRDYHRLDLGFNFRKERKNKKGKNQERIWTFGVYNAYNRQNAVFYYFSNNGQSDAPVKLYQQSGFPIIPSIKYSVKF